jgi:hypothetical protein
MIRPRRMRPTKPIGRAWEPPPKGDAAVPAPPLRPGWFKDIPGQQSMATDDEAEAES